MKLFDPKNPNEKKKMIAAAVLALVAILVLGYVFLGGNSSKPPTNQIARTSPTPARTPKDPGVQVQTPDDSSAYTRVVFKQSVPAPDDASRNIFAFYIPPSPTPKVVIPPTPTPTPTPPMTIRSLSPMTVFAGTPADFTLEVTGDKFTPAVHVLLDGRDLPTRFISPQQLFATVAQTWIKNPGVRQVMARNPDGTLYSNTVQLNINQPTAPNFNYVGLIGKPHSNDTAILQDKGSKDFIRVQRGDAVGGRFRVFSISEKEVVLVDATLKIPFHLSFTVDQNSPGTPYRPPARTVDDEP